AGTMSYNNYELLFHGLTYGFTNDVQASLTVLLPVIGEMPLVALGAVKWRFLSRGRVQLALQGTAGYLQQTGAAGTGDAFSVGAGGLASVCLREDCSSLASVSATYELVAPTDVDVSAHAIIYGGSVVHRVSTHVKLLGEVTSAAGGRSFGSLDN